MRHELEKLRDQPAPIDHVITNHRPSETVAEVHEAGHRSDHRRHTRSTRGGHRRDRRVTHWQVGQRLNLRCGILSAILFLLLVPRSMPAQASVPVRVVTVTVGVGNAMGWLGAQGERYFGPDRFSVFVGAGYTPSLDQYEPSGPTFAAGLRGYTRGVKHRGFLEASISQIFTEVNALEPGRRLYGPGLAAGYQFASRGGFTLMTSLGLGYAPGVDDGHTKVGGLANLGLGYTWRQRPR